MSSNPNSLVSIVIPVYNGANYLAEAIESALSQTHSNTEVIVVNDGSTDNGATRRVAERYSSRIRYLDQPNGGVASALNTGIAAMRGELFSWLSHDDVYRPEKIARQVETWQNFGQPCIVLGDFEIFTEDSDQVTRIVLDGYNVIARPLDAIFYGLINGCALLIPRHLFDEAGTFAVDLPTTQDYHLWYRMARTVPFVRCPYSDVRQRIHPLQGSRQYAHLDEASRMFTHLVDITPVRTMEAYEGSELRFLLKTRRALAPYAGLRNYLTMRIDRLLRQMNYSVAIYTEGFVSLASEAAALNRTSHPPSRIFTLPLDNTAPPVEDYPSLPGTCLMTAVTMEGTRPSDILRALEPVASGPVFFMQACDGAFPGKEPANEATATIASTLPLALQAFAMEDADVARPAKPSQIVSELEGLVVRHDALGKLATFLEAPDFNWDRAAGQLRVVSYDAPDLPAAESAERLSQVLKGEETAHYHRGLSENGIARLIKELVNPTLPTILFVQQGASGCAQTHLQSLMQVLSSRANCLTVYGTAETFHLGYRVGEPRMGLCFSLPNQLPDLVRILEQVGVTQVDVHHIMGFEAHAESLLSGLELPYDVTLTDYHMVAKNPFLCLDTGEFVGDKRLRNLEYNLLRRVPSTVLRDASRVIAVSRDQAARINDLTPGLQFVAARLWHEAGVQLRHVFVPALRNNEPLRVLIAGAIGMYNGQKLVLDVARQITSRGLPVQLHLLGTMDVPAKDRIEAVTIHGPCEADRFVETVSGIAPHVAWLPSQWPETWSHTFTEYANACLPIAATAVGSNPERCEGRPATWLLPSDATDNDWVNLFLRLHASQLQEPPRWTPVDHLPPLVEHFYFDEYLRPSAESR